MYYWPLINLLMIIGFTQIGHALFIPGFYEIGYIDLKVLGMRTQMDGLFVSILWENNVFVILAYGSHHLTFKQT